MPDMLLTVLIAATIAGAIAVTGTLCYLAGQNSKIAPLLEALLELRDEKAP
jgi:hypothetical protein